jgi:hypothetical protein
MKRIYCIESHELQFFFGEDGEMLHWFCCNDAYYRHEYMDGLMKKLGVEVVSKEAGDHRFKFAMRQVFEQLSIDDSNAEDDYVDFERLYSDDER